MPGGVAGERSSRNAPYADWVPEAALADLRRMEFPTLSKDFPAVEPTNFFEFLGIECGLNGRTQQLIRVYSRITWNKEEFLAHFTFG
jgi:hypothetical protein